MKIDTRTSGLAGRDSPFSLERCGCTECKERLVEVGLLLVFLIARPQTLNFLFSFLETHFL